MNVEIKTIFGERRFDLATGQTVQLLQMAEQWEKRTGCTPAQKTDPEPEWEDVPVGPSAEPPAPEPEKPAKPSRKELWFGAKPEPDPQNDQAPEPAPEPDRAHSGFLMIRCEECGKVTGTCVRNPITDFRCSCGHSTHLRGTLRPLEYTCKCGSRFRYRTNLEDEVVEIDCFKCGAPVTMILGSNGKYMQM